MRKRGERLLIITFLAPAILFYGLLVVYPVIKAFAVSLYDWNGLSKTIRFVGLDNFRLLFTSKELWGQVDSIRERGLLHVLGQLSFSIPGNNLFYTVVPGVLILCLALFFASVLARGLKGAKLFRITFFFPNVISLVVIALLWSAIYNPTTGLLNALPRLFHGRPWEIAWLDVNLMRYSLVAPMVWMAVGFYMVLYIAAIQNIPEDIFDAAKVDGASGWQTFRNVIWPLVWETTKVAVVFLIIGGLKVFDLIWVLSYGKPANQNHTFATYMYWKAFGEGDMGYATAVSVVLFLLVFTATAISLRVMRRETVTL